MGSTCANVSELKASHFKYSLAETAGICVHIIGWNVLVYLGREISTAKILLVVPIKVFIKIKRLESPDFGVCCISRGYKIVINFEIRCAKYTILLSDCV